MMNANLLFLLNVWFYWSRCAESLSSLAHLKQGFNSATMCSSVGFKCIGWSCVDMLVIQPALEKRQVLTEGIRSEYSESISLRRWNNSVLQARMMMSLGKCSTK